MTTRAIAGLFNAIVVSYLIYEPELTKSVLFLGLVYFIVDTIVLLPYVGSHKLFITHHILSIAMLGYILMAAPEEVVSLFVRSYWLAETSNLTLYIMELIKPYRYNMPASYNLIYLINWLNYTYYRCFQLTPLIYSQLGQFDGPSWIVNGSIALLIMSFYWSWRMLIRLIAYSPTSLARLSLAIVPLALVYWTRQVSLTPVRL